MSLRVRGGGKEQLTINVSPKFLFNIVLSFVSFKLLGEWLDMDQNGNTNILKTPSTPRYFWFTKRETL